MTLQEHIDAIKAAIADRMKTMSGIMTKAAKDNGSTPEGEDEKTVQGLEVEIKNLEANLARLEKIQKSQAALADTTTPVDGSTSEKGLNSTQGKTVIKTESNLPKGHGLAMIVRAKVASQQLAKNHSEYVSASDLLKSWNAPEIVQNVAKAVAGTTSSDEYSALIQTQNLVNEFMDVMRPQTIIGRIKGFREVPFNITVPTKTSGSIVNWVGEGKKKPVTNLVIGKTSLSFAKIAGIVPFSDELGKFSDPKVDAMVMQDLSDSITGFSDAQFLLPTKAETIESPASILHGVTPITAAGLTIDNFRSDLRKLRGQFITGNVSLTGCYYIMSETMASFMSDLIDALGNPVYRGMDAPVGEKTLKGLPVVESESAGAIIALIKPSEILLADDGGIDLSISSEATLDFNDGTDDVSLNLWQQNMIAVRAERYIRWKKRHALAAAWIDYSAQTLQ